IRTPMPRWQDHTSAIASGFLGDWLQARENPLAMPMQVRLEGRVLDTRAPDLPDASGTVVLLIHGLTELESVWHYRGEPDNGYGPELARALGATPLALRYNTGLPVHRNGELLAEELEQLLEHWPVPVENLILIGHSMGGLLIRAASHHGRQSGHQWCRSVGSCVYIGSPHDGSWLARGAHWAADRLAAMPRDYLRVAGEFIDLRSEGIRNLSRGEVTPPDVEEPPLLPGADHYVVSGLLARNQTHPVNALFGDALVHESSARGDERSGWVLTDIANFSGIHHIRLAHEPKVARQLREWLT
ncbi:MAG: esterase/lipase family protein, partial [Pseudomonadota bacterium]